MSRENVKAFLKEYKQNEAAMKLLKEYPTPETPEEAVRQVCEVAGKLGITSTPEEMMEVQKELMAEQKARTDASAEALGKLDDSALDDVNGGFYYYTTKGVRSGSKTVTKYQKNHKCCYDFTDDDCLREDACDFANVTYYGCDGRYFKEGDENSCVMAEISKMRS
jgi:hypothetical protein